MAPFPKQVVEFVARENVVRRGGAADERGEGPGAGLHAPGGLPQLGSAALRGSSMGRESSPKVPPVAGEGNALGGSAPPEPPPAQAAGTSDARAGRETAAPAPRASAQRVSRQLTLQVLV